MWVIPQRLVGDDLFRGKFTGKVLIHRIVSIVYINSDILRGKFGQILNDLVLFTSFQCSFTE